MKEDRLEESSTQSSKDIDIIQHALALKYVVWSAKKESVFWKKKPSSCLFVIVVVVVGGIALLFVCLFLKPKFLFVIRRSHFYLNLRASTHLKSRAFVHSVGTYKLINDPPCSFLCMALFTFKIGFIFPFFAQGYPLKMFPLIQGLPALKPLFF